ncbi:hypothetical protein Bhyg_06891 [Pseudolycoriella hygida]|uniref:DUF243 domain-containing protein n=1 Tax=Pseudolycoriella hygida TaxID=35572 RepID=A0A9Q0N350_9DIPT|nr:hypothetical protein Bhyg_06891 [Pseudolycoriella hygida]
MKAFMVLAFVVAVSARPEAGYNYNAPNRGGQQVGGGGFNTASVISLGTGQSYNGASTGSFNNGASLSGGSGGYSNQVSSGGYNNQVSSGGYNNQVSSGGYSSGGSTGSYATNVGLSSGSFGGGLSSGTFSGGAAFGGSSAPQQTLIQKHIYVHVPPPEPEVLRPQQQIQAGVAQKHYKIIFIKAPSPPTPSPAQIALAQQNQEKTIVYVLVKKPDEIGDVAIPSVPPTQPSKPEVYFIKYKTSSAERPQPHINALTSTSATVTGGSAISSVGTSSVTSLSQPAPQYGPPASTYGAPAQSGPY